MKNEKSVSNFWNWSFRNLLSQVFEIRMIWSLIWIQWKLPNASYSTKWWRRPQYYLGFRIWFFGKCSKNKFQKKTASSISQREMQSTRNLLIVLWWPCSFIMLLASPESRYPKADQDIMKEESIFDNKKNVKNLLTWKDWLWQWFWPIFEYEGKVKALTNSDAQKLAKRKQIVMKNVSFINFSSGI